MSSLPGVLKFDNTLGAILVGSFVSTFLYGLTCLQTFIYFQRYPRDRPSTKLLVSFLWSIDTLDVILTAHVCYSYLVTNFANPSAILFPTWSIKLHVLVTSISDFTVRSMFARRIYNLSHGNSLLTGGIIALSLVDLIIGTVITIKAFKIATYPGLSAVATLFYVNFGSNLSADVYVAVVLCYYLWRSRTGVGKTDSLIVTLILYTVNTGLLTALDASAGLITYAAMPNNFIFIAFYLNLSKLFVNSYLASLNAREGLIGKMKSDGMVSIHMSRVSTSIPVFRNQGQAGSDRPDFSQLQWTNSKVTGSDGAESKVETPVDSLPDALPYASKYHEQSTISLEGRGYAI